MTALTRSLLSAALLCALAGTAVANEPRRDADNAKALAQAREDLRRAAARVAELSRDQGDQGSVARSVRERVVSAGDRPMIGVVLAPDDDPGVRITAVTPDGAAAKAGLRSGDRIVSVAGTNILGSTGTLRVENARKLLGNLTLDRPTSLGYLRGSQRLQAQVTPIRDRRIALLDNDAGMFVRPGGATFIQVDPDGSYRITADSLDVADLAGIAPQINTEVVRVIGNATMRSGQQPRNLDERFPHLVSAFRWNGLNLASVDAGLGRYFGTDKGVLVLSSGDLDGLQAGDVIQRVDGKPVASPREVMDLLRDRRDDEKVAVDYLRDRRTAQARVSIPKLAWPAPPAPPAPPSPPAAPAAPSAPPAPPAPPKPPRVATADGGVTLALVVMDDARIAGVSDAG